MMTSYVGSTRGDHRRGLRPGRPVPASSSGSSPCMLGLGSLLNARLVMRLGLAAASCGPSPSTSSPSPGCCSSLAVVTDGHPPLWAFCVCIALLLPAVSLLTPNSNTAGHGAAAPRRRHGRRRARHPLHGRRRRCSGRSSTAPSTGRSCRSPSAPSCTRAWRRRRSSCSAAAPSPAPRGPGTARRCPPARCRPATAPGSWPCPARRPPDRRLSPRPRPPGPPPRPTASCRSAPYPTGRSRLRRSPPASVAAPAPGGGSWSATAGGPGWSPSWPGWRC